MEGIYLLELSNGALKIGRSRHLADRLRSHENSLAGADVFVTQSWTCTVHNSAEPEQQIIDALRRVRGADVLAGRETFTGIAFFVAMALARDICGHFVAAGLKAAPGVPQPVAHPVLWDLLEIMDDLPAIRVPTLELVPRLMERRAEYREVRDAKDAAMLLARQVQPCGLRTVRYRPDSRSNSVRGYHRDDVLDAIARCADPIRSEDWEAPSRPGQDPVEARPAL